MIHRTWARSRTDAEGQGEGCLRRAYGERVTFLAVVWESLVCQFKQKHGVATDEKTKLPLIRGSMLPSQSYVESFEEKLHDRRLQAVTLAHVISLQINRRPEQPKHMAITLDSNLTIQTRKRHISSMPTSIDQLTQKCSDMTHPWFLAAMRQPSWALYADFHLFHCLIFP